MRQQSGASGFAMLVYWLCVASIGNLIDYVPIRTFTDGTDLYQNMFAVKKGFGWSPWTLLIAFGNPTAAVLVYYFLRIMPSTLHWLFPASPAQRLVMVRPPSRSSTSTEPRGGQMQALSRIGCPCSQSRPLLRS